MMPWCIAIAWQAPAGTGGPHPGMNGASIIMAINDPDPDVFGMNATAPFVGTGVQEYVIGMVSAFRQWSEPAGVQSATEKAIDVTACFTSMTFTTDAVAGVALDVAGTQDLIWGFHKDTFLKG